MQLDIKDLFARHYRPLCLYALHYVGADDAAEDIVQECFVSLWQHAPRNPRSFLYTAVRNRCIDHLRRARLDTVDVAPHDLEGFISDDEARCRSEQEARLWEAIDRLPERCRQVFLMSKRDGMRYKEIAAELNISERTVEHQVAKAMQKLNRLLRSDAIMAVRRLVLLMTFMTLSLLALRAQTTTALRSMNVAVGVGHDNADSTRTRAVNVGIFANTDTLRGANIGLISAGTHRLMQGLQGALLINSANRVQGMQLSGLTNLSRKPLEGLQLAGLTNIAMGVKRGVQLSVAANVSAGFMRGVQVSAYNFTEQLNGSQIGLINVALRHPRGWQVGVLNVSRDTTAHKLGLVNINPNTRIDFMAFAGTTSKFNFAVRYRNRSGYSILGVGTHYMGLDNKFSGALYYRLGRYVNLSPRWSVSGDVGYYHVETFEEESSKPERLYSLQAHLNLDYRFCCAAGAFVSVGYGDTRHYGGKEYRHGLILQGGLTFNYNNHLGQRRPSTRPLLRLERDTTGMGSLYRFADPDYLEPHPWPAALQATSINLLVHGFDRFVMKADFAKVTLESIARNWRHGFVWDNDQFSTNLFAHPYHGNLYFNSARSRGLNFWQSVPYALGGSLMWEMLGEIEPPAINDVMATTVGGICLGEITHRMSALVLNDRSRGFRRFAREFLATVINPMQGVTRLMNGDAWRVRQTNYLYHDHNAIPVDFTLAFGHRYLADNGGLFRGEHNPYLSFFVEYGDVFKSSTNRPYDYFTAHVTFSLSPNQPFINGIHLLGRLWGRYFEPRNGNQMEFGLFQHFNYYDTKPVKDGTSLTPYRISEAASVGPGVIYRFPQVANVSRLEQRVFISGILLGGTKSDYYSFIDRDYNMGSGYSIKMNTLMEFPRMGRFVFNFEYYRVFTWKGYEQRDLTTVDPLYLNAQGDRGYAGLLVLNPAFNINLARGLQLEAGGAFFGRKTHYRYYHDVRARTFEVKLGLSYQL